MNKFFTIAKNTFTETIRQPIYAIIIIIVLLALFISPSITMYTLDDDNKFLREVALSTLFLAGLFISIFAASGSVAEEIENKTILTVLSKPIRRPIFILAKFTGLCLAVGLAHYLLSIAVIMTIRHGVLENAGDTHDWTVLVSAIISVGGAFLISAFLNYVYDWKFTSSFVVILSFFATISISLLIFIDPDMNFDMAKNGINALDVYGLVLLFFAEIIITAIAVAMSTRFNIAVTLSACIGVFMLGLISDYALGNLAKEYIVAKPFYYVIPNLQVFWIADAIYEDSKVTIGYIGKVAIYTAAYCAAILSLSVGLFQKRQVG